MILICGDRFVHVFCVCGYEASGYTMCTVMHGMQLQMSRGCRSKPKSENACTYVYSIVVKKTIKITHTRVHAWNCHECMIQVVQCEWILDVQLFNYHNHKNAETRLFDNITSECCCDTAVCAGSGLALDQCPETCDIFFNVQLSKCMRPIGCFITTINESITDSLPKSPYGYIFSFTLDIIPENVRKIIHKKLHCLNCPTTTYSVLTAKITG